MRQIPKEKILQKISNLNPHWIDSQIDNYIYNFKRRKYFDLFFPLASNFKVNRAIILMGPRRVGKTIILQQTIQEFVNQGKTSKDIIYIPLDNNLFFSYRLEEMLDLYKETVEKDNIEGCVIIFDEVQSLDGWDRELKTLVDQFPRTKFIASGSAAGALKRQSQESGAGRFIDFMLPPLTFYEYMHLLDMADNLLIKDDYEAISAKGNIEKLNKEYLNYLNYGGFPEAVFNEEIRKNPEKFIRESIIDKVIQKDLPSIYGINNVRELNAFFQHLIYQTGEEISYEALHKHSNIHKDTIKKYIQFLEAAYLIKTVKRVNDTSKTMKRTNFLKVYLTNPSMYTAVYGLLKEDDTTTIGHLVETSIFSQNLHNTAWTDKLFYARWSGRDAGEVDMVYLDEEYKPSWCLEVKWSDNHVDQYKSKLKSLIKFINKNKNKSAKYSVTTKTIQKKITLYDDIKISFTPAAIVCYNLGMRNIEESKI